MNILGKVKDAFRTAKEATARVEEERKIVEQEKTEKSRLVAAELRLYERMDRDAAFQKLQKEFYCVHEKIEEKYSIVNNMNAFAGELGTQLLGLCEKNMLLAEQLAPKWALYNQSINNVGAYKRAAMVYEKCGQFQEAANVCLRALKYNFYADGTSSGIRGRLTRMIKKGNLIPSEEMTQELLK